MDIVVIGNGLGNQMSQYAFFLKKKSINRNTRILVDIKSRNDHNGFELDKLFDVSYDPSLTNKFLYFIFRILGIKKYPLFSRPLIQLLKLLGIRLLIEDPNYDFKSKNLQHHFGLMFYQGGWHSERYFSSIRNEIMNTFRFNIVPGDRRFDEFVHSVQRTNSVSIHIRRGDYLNEIHMHTFGAVCSREYFSVAMKKIEELTDQPVYYIFTNDFDWVKENFAGESIVFVDVNTGTNSWRDLYLMTRCKHNIISNSSFSWWGAWLNINAGKIVITPKYFVNNIVTKDIYPDSWTQLKEY